MESNSEGVKRNTVLENHLTRLLSFSNENQELKRVLDNRLMTDLIIASGESVDDLKLLKSKPLRVCRWCFVRWTVGDYSFYIEPEKQISGAVRRLLDKDVNTLNKYQRKMVKKFRKSAGCNHMVVICKFCQKKTRIPLKKTEKAVNAEPIEAETNKKKKKRKKDMFAGLKPHLAAKYVVNRYGKSYNTQTGSISEVGKSVKLSSSNEDTAHPREIQQSSGHVANPSQEVKSLIKSNQVKKQPISEKKSTKDLKSLQRLLRKSDKQKVVEQKNKSKTTLSSFLEMFN